jgi:hypothetical protein
MRRLSYFARIAPKGGARRETSVLRPPKLLFRPPPGGPLEWQDIGIGIAPAPVRASPGPRDFVAAPAPSAETDPAPRAAENPVPRAESVEPEVRAENPPPKRAPRAPAQAEAAPADAPPSSIAPAQTPALRPQAAQQMALPPPAGSTPAPGRRPAEAATGQVSTPVRADAAVVRADPAPPPEGIAPLRPARSIGPERLPLQTADAAEQPTPSPRSRAPSAPVEPPARAGGQARRTHGKDTTTGRTALAPPVPTPPPPPAASPARLHIGTLEVRVLPPPPEPIAAAPRASFRRASSVGRIARSFGVFGLGQS